MSQVVRKHYGAVVRILYHTDQETMFRALPPVSVASGGHPPPPGGSDERFICAGNVHDELWGKHAVQL